MQGFCRKFITSNPFQCLRFAHAFQGRLLYSTSTSTTTTTTTTTTAEDSLTNYLVHSLGFTHQKAILTFKKLAKFRKVNDLNFDSNASSVVGFFKNYGFDDSHLIKFVSSYPRLLFSDVDNTLKPKLQFLQNQGFSRSDIIRVISASPKLLRTGLNSAIVPALEILRQVLVCDAHVVAVLSKASHFHLTAVNNYLLPNIALLTSYGIPIQLIRNQLLRVPAGFLRKPDIFEDIVTRVEQKLGISRNSPMFLYGIQLLSGSTEGSIESKCRMFKSFGWTQSDVQTFMMKNTCCFTVSDATIKKKLDFLMNELRLEPAYLISRSGFFSCSLEKRVIPRHKVLLFLKEQGLLKKNPSLYTAICMSESRFSNMFVLPFNEVHELYAELTGCKMKMLTQESAESLS